MEMTFTQSLKEKLDEKHLLKHPYYQRWTDGSLPFESIQNYARQYFSHVDAFPRYISAIHSLCGDLKSRQVLLQNLNEEEMGNEPHPNLWMKFSEGLGNSREATEKEELFPETQALLDSFEKMSRSSYAEGLGALFAYEQQIPEVAKFKIDALKKHYDVNNQETLKFFEVHKEADVYHSDACADLMEKLSPEEKDKARGAAVQAATALWTFLDGMEKRI